MTHAAPVYPRCEGARNECHGRGGGALQLLESNISDEEVHALSAFLRNNTNIDELNLRGNNITDDGARALGRCLLAGVHCARWICEETKSVRALFVCWRRRWSAPRE